jgi:type I restriction enzyme, S subunit
MGSEFQTLTLGLACTKIGSGATPKGGKEAYLGGSTSLIRSQNVYNDRFAKNGLVYIDDAQANELGNVVVEREDVLLNITGDSVARCCIVDASVLPARVNQHVAIIRPNKNILNAKFLRFVLVSPKMQEQLFSLASAGATRDALTKAMIESLKIEAPVLTIQNRISHILGTLDDKIELNRRTNETLEAIARAIFKSWFVDFDPVKAKAAGQKPFGMDDETAALVPSEFEDSELGKIPKGWRVGAASDFFEVNPLIKLRKGATYPYVEMANLPTNSASISSFREREFSAGSKFTNGDTLIARITPCLENGKTAFVDLLPKNQPGWGSTEFIVLRARDPFPTEASYLLARDDDFRNHLISNMTGSSGRQRVPESCLKTFKMVCPARTLCAAFGIVVKPVFEALRVNRSQARELAQTRDLLLPKLLSGEIDVSELKL